MVDLQKKPVPEVIRAVTRHLPVTDAMKESIMDEAMVCRVWGVQRNRVIVLGWLGRVLFRVDDASEQVLVMFIPGETEEQSDSDLVWTSQYVEFLSPKKDLKAFSDYLKARMHLKVPFEMVYNGQV